MTAEQVRKMVTAMQAAGESDERIKQALDMARSQQAPGSGVDPNEEHYQRRQQLQQNVERGRAAIARLDAEPAYSLREAGRDFANTMGSVGSDILDAATLGGYRKLRDKVPVLGEQGRAADEEARSLPGAGALSVGAKTVGYMSPLGVPGLLSRAGVAGAEALVPEALPLLRSITAGGLTGGMVSAGEASVRGASPVDIGMDALRGLLTGGVAGAVTHGLVRYIGGAPTRKAESELAGLKTQEGGTQYSSRVKAFRTHGEDIQAELDATPQTREIRALIKTDKQAALPIVQAKLDQVSADLEQPFYQQLAQSGRDGVSGAIVDRNLAAVENSFAQGAERAQRAAVSELRDVYRDMAAQNNGVIPAKVLSQEATSFQKQGVANTRMYGAVPLSSQMRSEVGSALRGSIADHIESLPASDEAGKALRQVFEQTNRQVSTWVRIRDLVDQAVERQSVGATPMGTAINQMVHIGKTAAELGHKPIRTTIKLVAGRAPDIIDRRVLGPLVGSEAGQAMAPLGRLTAEAAPRVVSGLDPLEGLPPWASPSDQDRMRAEKILYGQ